MRRAHRRVSVILALALAGCTGETPVIELYRVAPAADPGCGAPVDAQTLVVTALGDFPAAEVTAVSRSIGQGSRLELENLPPATRVLRVDVLGGAGALRTIGKTMPIDLMKLGDLSGSTGSANIPVFMAPPRGMCPTGPMLASRAAPLVARAGTGALVAGGMDETGTPVGTEPGPVLERYDPSTGAFVAVEGDSYGTGEHGLLGATITALGKDATRVVIAGGGVPAYQIYDAAGDELSAAFFLRPGRGFHAAVALDEKQVLLAGGCGRLTATHACEPGSELASTSIINTETGTMEDGPVLRRPRIGGVALQGGAGSVLLFGGTDEAGAPVAEIERLWLDGRPGELLAGTGSTAVTLASGSALLGFAAGAPDGGAGILAPGASAVREVTPAPWPLEGASMTALQDGRVLVFGAEPGSGTGHVLFYEPNRGAFRSLDTTGDGPGADHGAVLLDDGTVLVAGGRASAARAWVFRPDLTGPYASDITIAFADPELAQHLIPRDPAMATVQPAAGGRPAHYRLTSSGGGGSLPSEWALIGGPVFARATMQARLRAPSGGVALLLGFQGPESYVTAVLIPGQPATAYRIEEGAPQVLRPCTGEVIAAGDLAPGSNTADVTLERDAGLLRVFVAGRVVLDCADPEPLPAGLMGLGVAGASGATVEIDFVSVTR